MNGPLFPCKRKGCGGQRGKGEFLCSPCWRQVDRHYRDRYSAARRRGLTHIAKGIRQTILQQLARLPLPAALHADPVAAYRRTAAQLGERDEGAPL